MPIPEKRGTLFHPGPRAALRRGAPCARAILRRHIGVTYISDLRFPRDLLQHAMHLDPDFEMLTYGDDGARRGAGMARMSEGDLLVFYGGLRPVHPCEHRLIYALLGLYVVEEVAAGGERAGGTLARERACSQDDAVERTDIVVRAKPELSGRFDRCIPIGEWRERRLPRPQGRLKSWGGLSVRDGLHPAERRATAIHQPARFLEWLEDQAVQISLGNNCHPIEPRIGRRSITPAQANCVMPGMATGATSIGPQS